MFHSLPLHHKTSQLTKDRVTLPAAISVREFSLKVGGRDVLCDVTLDIRKGEVLGLIGRTGAGKSVLMRAMCRLLQHERQLATTGSLTYGDTEVFSPQCDLPALRRKVAYIPEIPNPFPLSVWDNIAYGLKLNQIATSRHEMAEAVETALRRCMLWDHVRDVLHKRRGVDLPRHQQRLLCIARSISVQPEVLLLDRSTGSIDQGEGEALCALSVDLKKDHAVVAVSATLAETAQIADRVAYFEQGRLVEVDSAEMIFTAALKAETRGFIDSTSA